MKKNVLVNVGKFDTKNSLIKCKYLNLKKSIQKRKLKINLCVKPTLK